MIRLLVLDVVLAAVDLALGFVLVAIVVRADRDR